MYLLRLKIMIECALIPITAILNRVRGGGIYQLKWERQLEELEALAKISAVPANRYEQLVELRKKSAFRKPIAAFLLALSFMFIDIAANFYTRIWWHSFILFAIVFSGMYLRNVVGTHRGLDILWHKNIKSNIFFMCARGLLTLGTTIPIAYVLHNWWIAPLGLIGALQGIWYKVATYVPISNQNAFVELADGATFGLILALCLLI